jgi:small subunit ribosomal protein S2
MVSKSKEKKEGYGLDPGEMIKAGVHLGHRVSRVHPQMQSYLLGQRDTIHIINTELTCQKFREALKFIEDLVSRGGILLLVGTKPHARELTQRVAREIGMPYVIERWLGGTFTNFPEIKKRIDYFRELEEKKKKGELEKYTKKERAKIEKELQDLDLKFGGIKNLQKLPEAILVLDMVKDRLACKEAREKGVKIVGISDTNADPTLADYPIPANDDAISSLNYILGKIKEVILKAKPK